MTTTIRQEFRLKALGLSHSEARDFYEPQIACGPCGWRVPYLVYRFTVAAYVLFWNVYAHVTIPKLGHHYTIVFLTNWTYLLLALYLTLAAINTLCDVISYVRATRKHSGLPAANDVTHTQDHCCNLVAADQNTGNSSTARDPVLPRSACTRDVTDSGDVPRLPWPVRIQWMLFSVVTNCTLLISTVYYAVLFPVMLQYMPALVRSALDLNLHAVSSALVLLELTVTRTPVRLAHALYPLLYSCVYLVFSAAYWAADRERNVLYEHLLDWRSPARSLAVSAAWLAAIPLIQTLLYVVYRLRGCLAARCTCRRGGLPETTDV